MKHHENHRFYIMENKSEATKIDHNKYSQDA